MKILNIIRKLIKLPIRLFFYPLFLIVLFITTDWENEFDVNTFKENAKHFLW